MIPCENSLILRGWYQLEFHIPPKDELDSELDDRGLQPQPNPCHHLAVHIHSSGRRTSARIEPRSSSSVHSRPHLGQIGQEENGNHLIWTVSCVSE